MRSARSKRVRPGASPSPVQTRTTRLARHASVDLAPQQTRSPRSFPLSGANATTRLARYASVDPVPVANAFAPEFPLSSANADDSVGDVQALVPPPWLSAPTNQTHLHGDPKDRGECIGLPLLNGDCPATAWTDMLSNECIRRATGELWEITDLRPIMSKRC